MSFCPRAVSHVGSGVAPPPGPLRGLHETRLRSEARTGAQRVLCGTGSLAAAAATGDEAAGALAVSPRAAMSPGKCAAPHRVHRKWPSLCLRTFSMYAAENRPSQPSLRHAYSATLSASVGGSSILEGGSVLAGPQGRGM